MPPGIPHWLYGHESNNRCMLIQGIILSPQNHKFASKPGQGIRSTQTCCRANHKLRRSMGTVDKSFGEEKKPKHSNDDQGIPVSLIFERFGDLSDRQAISHLLL